MTSALKQEIIKFVDEYWEDKTSPILLSLLGAKISGENSKELKSHSISLNEFLMSELSDEIVIYRDTNNPIRIGAFPIRATQKTDFSSQRYFENRDGISPHLNRYNHALWAAFRVPLPTATKRYLQISDTIVFSDVKSSDKSYEGKDGCFEIKKTQILSDKNEKPEIIAKSIHEWATSHKIDETKLFAQTTHQNRKTILNLLLNSLTEDELVKVSMPLSIVKKLNSKMV